MNGYVDDGRIWCVYDIVSTEAASTLLYVTTGITAIEIDGVSVSVAKTYLFSSTGEHLIKFTLGSSTTSIVQNQFYQVIRLKEIVTPSSITAIGQRAFYGCTGLTTISLPAVRTIAYQCFYNCTSLTGDLILPSLTAFSGAASTGGEFYNTRFTKIVSLGTLAITRNQTFGGNTSLVSAELPSTITTLTQWTFYNDTALKYVICRATTPPSFDRAFQGCSSLSAIYVPKESVSAYQSASGWSSYSSIIFPIGDEKRLNINHMSLGDFRRRIMIGISTPKPPYPDPYEDDGWIWCYYNVTTTESATQLVSSYVTDLGANFIIDGETVARTASYTFSTTGEHLVKMHKTGSCRNFWQNVKTLKRIYFPSVVTSFSSNSVLGGCSALTYVHLSDLSSIAGQAFGSCSSLKKINLQDTHITTTGSGSYGAFQSCTSLEKITLPTTVTSIGGNCEFKGCTKLVKINLNSLPNLTSIAREAFSTAPLTGMELSLPKLTYVGIAAFSGSKIKKIINLGKISYVTGASLNGAFQGMTSLTEVTIPTPVGSLQQYCFNGDTALAKMTIEATTPPTIGSSALTRCPLTYIYVPEESVDDYKTINWSSYAARIHPIDDGWSLPDGYTAVPYVQTDSRAYIDTGVAGGVSTNWVRASFQWSTYVQGGAIYGNYVDDSHTACMALLNDSASLLVGNNTNLGQSCSGTAADTRTTLRVTNSSALVKGTSTTITADTSLSDNTANIFLGTNGPNHAENDIGLRIYHFDIFDYSNNVYLVRYIPCKRNSDNKAGLYDRQNNVFRPSDTAVDFIAGT